MATKTKAISLKLLIDNSSKKVLFAEAGKDFIDFLFGLLQIPLGSIIGLLRENGMDVSDSLGRICDSVTNLDPDYFLPNMNKNAVLRPEVASPSTPTLLQYFATEASYCDPVFSTPFGSCSPSKEVGCVKGMVTYMVMDNLKVQPSSNISIMTLLNTFHVKNVACLEEKTVNVDLKKGLKLVKASFESDTVLTDVFIGKVAPEDCKPEFCKN